MSATKGWFEQLRSMGLTTDLNCYIHLKQKFLTQNSWQQLSFSLFISSCSHFKLSGLWLVHYLKQFSEKSYNSKSAIFKDFNIFKRIHYFKMKIRDKCFKSKQSLKDAQYVIMFIMLFETESPLRCDFRNIYNRTTEFTTVINKTATFLCHLCLSQREKQKRLPAIWERILTTSSKAALLPKEQVRCARQLTNEEKSSFGMAVKILRGNTVIRLLIILEIPTASESSISIL